MTETFYRAVVQVHVGHLELSGTLHRPVIPFNRKAVILRRDENLPSLDFLDRMISPAMSVRHFHSRSTEGEADDLVPQADSKSGNTSGYQSANDTRSVRYSLWIAGAVGEKNSIRLFRQDSVCWSVGGGAWASGTHLVAQA